MEISTLQIIAIFLFSCIAGMGSVLDEFQTHRPLIACTVIGLILGDLKTGIMLGGTLELIALGWMNVGAAQSPDSALASIISAILVIVGQQSIATGIAIALPVAAAGQVLTVFARTITVVFQHAADKAAEDARFRTIDILHVSALGVQALRVAIPALIVSLFVSADMVSNMLNAIPEFVTRGLQIAGGFIVVVGYAMVLRMMGVKYLMPFFFLGFLAGGYLDLSLLAFGGVGVIMALVYIQLNPQWRKAEPQTQAYHRGERPTRKHKPLPLPLLTNLTINGAIMEQRKITRSDLVSMFLRSNLQQASFNFERIHGLGFCYDMIPAIKRLYPLKEDQVAALRRHLVFFNTTPAVCGPVIGVTAAMEEARANGAEIDDGTINGIKVGLMGPLAGVGDPLVWGTLRPITAALGASLALSGNILGPLLFFFIFNAVRLAMKWYGLQLGFRKGVNIVSDMGGNLLQKLTEGASILGLFVMGVLVTKWTSISVPLVVSQTPGADGSTITMTVQNILDQLCPGLLALGLTLLMVRLLNKKINPVWLIFALFGLGIIGNALGFLS